MAALTLRRSRTALGAAYRWIARHKGAAVAVFATARKLAPIIFRMLRFGQDYADIGIEHYEARFTSKRTAGLHNSAKSLGFNDCIAHAAGICTCEACEGETC